MVPSGLVNSAARLPAHNGWHDHSAVAAPWSIREPPHILQAWLQEHHEQDGVDVDLEEAEQALLTALLMESPYLAFPNLALSSGATTHRRPQQQHNELGGMIVVIVDADADALDRASCT